MQTIGIIGQGFVGAAVREGMKHHYDVKCFDIDPTKYSNTKSIFEIVEQTDIIFLCVPTPMKKTGDRGRVNIR